MVLVAFSLTTRKEAMETRLFPSMLTEWRAIGISGSQEALGSVSNSFPVWLGILDSKAIYLGNQWRTKY
jgi:hypothetical protein